jgi:selenocysteine lyase/cysteine desulfurase
LPREQFPVVERYRYFDHAGVSPLPNVAAEAARWWLDRMQRQGKVDYGELEQRIEHTRVRAAELLHVPAPDLAFVKNTTEGLGFVANGLDWSPGDRVLVPDREFPSTIYPWLSLRDRGVRVDRVTPVGDGGTLPIDALTEAIEAGPPPKVVALSWVQYGRGARTDLAALAARCHHVGALLCADVIQGAGVVPTDLEAWGVDFAMTAAHKWQLGPEGIGVLYVPARLRDRLRPLEPGWASVPRVAEWENLGLEWDDSARRFEGGSPNTGGVLTWGASLGLLLDTGIDAIWSHVSALGDHLENGVAALDGVSVLSDRSPEARSGIVSIAVEGRDPAAVAECLGTEGFVCAPRSGGVRIAPHGYTSVDDVDALVDALGRVPTTR